MWYIWKRALLHKLILQTLSPNTVSCHWFWERHHLFNIYVSWDTCLRNRVAELFVTYKDLMCNGIQWIVLRRLSCSWSIEPRKKAVYNTDFNFNIHKILPELFFRDYSYRVLWSVLLKAVHSGVILRVLLYWMMTLKNQEITTSPVSNGRIVLFWTNIWVICHFSLSAYRKYYKQCPWLPGKRRGNAILRWTKFIDTYICCTSCDS